MPVLAAVVRNVLAAALSISCHMPAEHLRSASLYRRHYLKLAQVDMPGIGPPLRRTMLAEYVSNLQLGLGATIAPDITEVLVGASDHVMS